MKRRTVTIFNVVIAIVIAIVVAGAIAEAMHNPAGIKIQNIDGHDYIVSHDRKNFIHSESCKCKK